jgi:prepilin-type processing-associated H-X9-DG protein
VIPTYGLPAGKPTPRVRTYDMNIWIGGNGGAPPTYIEDHSLWRVFKKSSDLSSIGGNIAWLFIDQREDWFGGTASFDTDMKGYPNNPNASEFFWDYPGTQHNGGASVAFVDGHVEAKHWVDPRTRPPLGFWGVRGPPGPPGPQPKNPDIFWLQDHATRRK